MNGNDFRHLRPNFRIVIYWIVSTFGATVEIISEGMRVETEIIIESHKALCRCAAVPFGMPGNGPACCPICSQKWQTILSWIHISHLGWFSHHHTPLLLCPSLQRKPLSYLTLHSVWPQASDPSFSKSDTYPNLWPIWVEGRGEIWQRFSPFGKLNTQKNFLKG